jgi:hypothetical protein
LKNKKRWQSQKSLSFLPLVSTPLIHEENDAQLLFSYFFLLTGDVPPSSLMDSTASPKVKTTKGEGLGAHSLDHNISEVEGRARASRWGLRKLTSKSITHMDLHKPNNLLVSAYLERF